MAHFHPSSVPAFSPRARILYGLLLLGFFLQTLYLVAQPKFPIFEGLIWVGESFGILVWILALCGQLGPWSQWVREASIETGEEFAEYSLRFGRWVLLPWLVILSFYTPQSETEVWVWLGLIFLTLLSLAATYWPGSHWFRVLLVNAAMPFALITLGHILSVLSFQALGLD